MVELIKNRVLLFLLFEGLIILFTRHSLFVLYDFSIKEDLYSYIIFIPLISAYLFYFKRKSIFSEFEFSLMPGILFSLAGVILYFSGHRLINNINQNDYLAFTISGWLIMSIGGFLTFFGWQTFKKAIFPLCFLFLMVPIPSYLLNSYIIFLQKASEEVSYVVFKLLEIPIYRSDDVFQLPNFTLEVAKECSGVRSSIGLWITAILSSYIFLKRSGYRLLLLLVVIPIAIFKNGLRIVTLGLLASYVDPIYITNHWLHKSGGILYFSIALLLLFFPWLFFLMSREGRSKYRKRAAEREIRNMESSSKIQTAQNVNKKYFLPFSPYQIALYLFDASICIISLYLFYFKYLIRSYDYTYQDIFLVLILIIPLMAFFPSYRLYSYHTIFRKKLHVKQIIKAFTWSILSFSVIYSLYILPSLFSNYNSYDAPLIFGAVFIVAILGRSFADYLAHLVLAIGIAFVTVGVTGLILGNKFPLYIANIWLTGRAVLASMLLVIAGRFFMVHTVYNNWLRRYFRRQMLIIGENDVAQTITEHIIKYNAPFWINGRVSLGRQKCYNDKKLLDPGHDKRTLGTIYQLPEIIKENHVQEIIVTDSSIDKRELISLLDFSVSNGIVVWFPPYILPIIPMKLNIDDFCGLPMIKMCLQRNPAFFKGVKRGVDLILSSILLLLSAPILSLIAIAIKLDSDGPVFYMAEAVGENGRHFKMFKFRSMLKDGDHGIHRKFVTKLIKGEMTREKKSVLKITNDPRVTRVGKFIRRLSLDELPQLFNVIKGDMSLVGPRPCLPYEYELYKDWHRKRNSVRPGITGLWQIAGRSGVSFEEMILLDLYYIYNRNLLTDLSILFETISVVLKMEGAY